MRAHPLRGAARNVELDALHETFFVVAIATVLCIRTQLWLTNYPQLGGHGLHIAHLLYGGILMLAALGILLSLLGRSARRTAAVVGGIGFGFFIDELGKFITADNNYFFKPAAGLIYLVFLLLFVASRLYRRRRGLTEAERVRNALELIGEASQGPFPEEFRDRALALLEGVGPDDPLRAPLVELAGRIDVTPNPDPPWYRRFADSVAARYERWAEQGWLHGVVIGVFVVWALSSVIAIAGLVFSFGFSDDAARIGFQDDSIQHLAFVNCASAASTAVSVAFVVVGLGRLLRGERLEAYEWLARALLVSIFVTRVFSFVESQFGAVFGLAVDVLLLVTIRLMSQQERRSAARPPAGESAAPAPG